MEHGLLPEAVCSAYVLLWQVCTFSTPNHIAWSVPLLPPSYYLPRWVVATTSFIPSCNQLLSFTCNRTRLILAHVTGTKSTQNKNLCLASSAY